MRKRESSFFLLEKILAQEARQGYADQLVMGGLGAYVQRWRRDAESDAASDVDRALAHGVAESLAPYASLTPEQREEAIAASRPLLNELNAHFEEHLAALPPEQEPPAPPESAEASHHEPAPALASLNQNRPAPQQQHPARAQQPQSGRQFGLDAPVTTLPGINVGYGAKLAKLGVRTIRDLLYLFPRRYNDFSHMKRIAELEIGAVETVVGSVTEAKNVTGRNGKVRTEALIGDETGVIKVVWFNQPYLASQLKSGAPVVLSGKIDVYLGRKVMESPELEEMDTDELLHTGRLVPVYPLTEGIGDRWMRRLQKRVVDRWAGQVVDFLPPAVLSGVQLSPLPQSLAQIHFPDTADSLEQARRRLAFDEFFLIQVGLAQRRRVWQQSIVSTPIRVDHTLLGQLTADLPFTLTGAQAGVVDSILHDISQSCPMARLVQGDVGSGKTVVALLAMLAVVADSYQAAIMAPTEILARQHYKTITSLLLTIARKQANASVATDLDAIEQALAANDLPDVVTLPPLPMLPAGISVARLVGSTKDAGKQTIRAGLAAGEIDIAVGTHALLEENVTFDRLTFAVIDEQHRFGVMQRANLRQKGYNPHILVMTATPIPRTLALTLYGDLDISTIDELPPGRQVVKTRWLEPRDRDRAYGFIRRQVQAGSQAFVICPLVEESEAMETKAAVDEYERLRSEVFPDLRVGLVHGRMKPTDKDETMSRFAHAELDILVATAVVEVGVDVPNATVMLIEGANHFGLAQLHQFRGRVGRGSEQSYCILLADESRVTEENPRLLAVEQTHDGFKLAEIDLEIRGMGEFFGTRQSGLPDLKIARISDRAILELARDQARSLLESDPDLVELDNQALAQKVSSFWSKPAGEGDLS